MGSSIERFRKFVHYVSELMNDPNSSEEKWLLNNIKIAMSELVSVDDWLPASLAEDSDKSYVQNLLYGDPQERFSIVSYIWGPNQGTPIHNHTVWGVIGVLRGSEQSQRYEQASDGSMAAIGDPDIFRPGDVTAVSPTIGDIHAVSNPSNDTPAISIHIYGGNIGTIERDSFAESDGSVTKFVSGYSNELIPNLWWGNNKK